MSKRFQETIKGASQIRRIGWVAGNHNGKVKTNAAKTAPGSQTDAVALKLQKEYIKNLQQQIYFLEMEVKLMKENPGFTNGGQMMGGAPSDDVPFEQHVAGLRHRFSDLEKDFLKKTKLVEEQLKEEKTASEKYRQELEKERSEVDEWRIKLSRQEEEFNRLRSDAKRNELDSKKRIERLEAKVEIKTRELQDLKTRLVEEKVQRSTKEQALYDEIKALKSDRESTDGSAQELEGKVRALEIELIETQEKLKSKYGNEGQLRQDIREAQEKTRTAELALKKSAMEVENLQGERESLLHEIDRSHLELKEMKKQLSLVQEELAVEKNKMETMVSSGETWSAELVDLKQKGERLEVLNAELQGKNDTKRAEIEALREEVARLKEDITEVRDQFDHINSEHEALQGHFAVIDKANTEYEKDNFIQSEQIEALRKKCDSLQEMLKLEKDRSGKAEQELTDLRASIELQNAIKSLKTQDFDGLMKSNMEVAQNIERLVEKFALTPVSATRN